MGNMYYEHRPVFNIQYPTINGARALSNVVEPECKLKLPALVT